MEKHPLHIKHPDLQTSPEVKDAVEKEERLTGEKVPKNPNERIEAYMDRLENVFLNKDERVRERNIEMLRDNIYDTFIIKKEEVPESYFELQKRVARERGQPVEEIPLEMRERMVGVAIEDQKASLDAWVNYLSSDDAVYPTWFKYFVFRNITKLSQFDKELGKFKERTDSTVAPFPDIYREPLAQICDAYEKVARDNKSLKDPEIQEIFSKKFPTLYAEFIQKSLEHGVESKEEIKGEWIKYKQGDMKGSRKLYDSLQGKGTGWCTAGESTARTQIESGDFYVYYTYDKDNNPNEPRIAIRMQDSQIGEIRGVNPHQEMEPVMADILEEKLKEFGPEAGLYKKKSADMKHLTFIEKAIQEGTELSKEDLRFLYEIDSKIEGFGYERDPRIEELRNRRNRREDIQIICDCDPSNIARNLSELQEDTEVYCYDASQHMQSSHRENDDTLIIFDFREEKNIGKLPKLMELVKKLEETGSLANPDMSFEGGVVNIYVPKEKLKDLPTALKLYKEADNGSQSYIWSEWEKMSSFKIPEASSLEVVILSYNEDTDTRKSSDKIVADMDKLGLRPATFSELVALGVAKPEFNKRSDTYLVGLGTKESLVGGLLVPNLDWIAGGRGLLRNRWTDECYGDSRFVCVRK